MRKAIATGRSRAPRLVEVILHQHDALVRATLGIGCSAEANGEWIGVTFILNQETFGSCTRLTRLAESLPCLTVRIVKSIIISCTRTAVVTLQAVARIRSNTRYVKRHDGQIITAGRYVALNGKVVQADVIAIAAQTGLMLQQQIAGGEVLALGIYSISH